MCIRDSITHDPIIIEKINVLGEAVDMVGGPQIRNAGTIGGNTCNGVTSADSASTLFAWDAIIELTGVNGKRYLPIKDFYIKAGTVDINVAEGEIQTAILIPKASYENTYGFYLKYGMRNAMEIATTGCSVNCRLSADKTAFDRVRIAYGVAGPVPMRAPAAEEFINGKPITMGNIEEFSRKEMCIRDRCCTQVGGRLVKLDCSREETFVSNRVRHAIRIHIISWLRKDGTIAAKKVECFSNQGAYASHGHSIVAKALGSFNQHYPCPNFEGDALSLVHISPAVISGEL